MGQGRQKRGMENDETREIRILVQNKTRRKRSQFLISIVLELSIGQMCEESGLSAVTRQKVPSSPREFFAKLYESNEVSSGGFESPDLPSKSEEVVDQERVNLGLRPFLWPASFAAAAAAQFQWNLAYNLRSTAVATLRPLAQTGSTPAPNPHSSTLPQFHISPAFNSFLARKRRRDGRVRRQRTTFSSEQTVSLEIEFQRAEYISRSGRCELAQRLGLSETQIKIWFQNRRAKDKRLEKTQMDQQVFNILNSCYQTP